MDRTARAGATLPPINEVRITRPPGARPLGCTATRNVRSLDALAKAAVGSAVLVDGVLWFADMSATVPFDYLGRGRFYTDSATAPELTAPIAPSGQYRGVPAQAGSYLNISYATPTKDAWNGDRMLTIRATSTNPDKRTVVASVDATQGVKPVGAVNVTGNLACGFINKAAQTEPGSSLDIHYNTYALPLDVGLVREGHWHVSALSVRACQVREE